jgi:dolichyl-phosphate-mannose-protein mannosyltransferase
VNRFHLFLLAMSCQVTRLQPQTIPTMNPQLASTDTKSTTENLSWASVSRRLVAMNKVALATNAFCVALILLGVFWRLVDLSYPSQFTFDEHHFVSNARNYLQRQVDWNDHPPLGKLLLIPGMAAFGDNGLGWRISSALLGLGVVWVAGLNSKLLFRNNQVALFTATFVAMDGFFISYSRTALLDTPLTFFMYLALYFMLLASRRSLALAAVCVGLAVATKWTGVCVFLLAPLLLWRARRSQLHLGWMLAVAGLVYVAIWTFALALTKQPISLAGMFSSNANLLKHHAGFTVWDNAASSAWYTWPFLVHPLILHHESVAANFVRATTCLGNPLVWFATTAAVLWMLERILVAGQVRWKERDPSPHGGIVISLAAMIALQLPFIITHRQSYIWHYLGAYGLGLGLLAWVLVQIQAWRPKAVLGFVLCAAAVSVVYAPLWTNTVVSEQAFVARLPFASWR